MFNEMISNVLNVGLAVWVVYAAMQAKQSGKAGVAVQMIMWAGAILGIAELIDMFQIFPDGTFLADLMYEKEIPVLVLLALAVNNLKGGKK